MLASFVVAFALCNLGCQNKNVDPQAEAAPPMTQSVDVPAPGAIAPTAAPAVPAATTPAQTSTAAPAVPAATTPAQTSTAAPAVPATTPLAPAITTAAPAGLFQEYPDPLLFQTHYPRPSYDDTIDLYPTHGGAIHATIYSFFWGKDPNIPSAAEIEESVYGPGSDH